MKIQKLFREVPADLSRIEPFSDWQELSPEFEFQPVEDCILVVAHIKEEDFDKLTHIFQNREDAMGATDGKRYLGLIAYITLRKWMENC